MKKSINEDKIKMLAMAIWILCRWIYIVFQVEGKVKEWRCSIYVVGSMWAHSKSLVAFMQAIKHMLFFRHVMAAQQPIWFLVFEATNIICYHALHACHNSNRWFFFLFSFWAHYTFSKRKIITVKDWD